MLMLGADLRTPFQHHREDSRCSEKSAAPIRLDYRI
jgi:hypothetical protein